MNARILVKKHMSVTSSLHKKFIMIGASCGAVAIAIALTLTTLWLWAQQPSSSASETKLVVRQAARLHEVSQQLFQKGIVAHPRLWWLYTKIFGDFRLARSGTYTIPPHASPHQILEKILSGEHEKELLLSITIPEGWNLKQVAQRLENLGLGSPQEIQEALADPSLRQEFSLGTPHLEGYLYPETYQIYDRIPPLRSIIRMMIQQFFKVLPHNYKRTLKKHSLNLNQWVIFASLIEKETMHADEKSMISEVIWNRLHKGIPLGIDAALIYGISDYAGDITFRHLADARNPYNTRIHKGLPPSAIAMVSIASLQAVFTPTQKGYLYYVLKEGEQKRHHFSKTLRSHNAAVRRLVKSSRRSRASR